MVKKYEKESIWWIWVIVGLLVVISFIFYYINKIDNQPKYREESWKIISDPLQIISPENKIVEISEEEATEIFIRILGPATGYLVKNYPIESVREEFANAVQNIGGGREVEYHPSGKIRETGGLATSFCTDGSCAKPLIVYWMPEWKEMTSVDAIKKSSFEQAKREFEDTLIMATCHEYFHCHNQSYWKKGLHLTLDELVNSESECWGYTIEKVIWPMIENGRGPGKEISTYQLAFAYKTNGYNRFSPEWKNLIRSWILEK